jgi:hypothetical protein
MPFAGFDAARGMPPAAPGPAGVQFFEQNIRPVLVKHCYECHAAGAKKIRGELRLDTRAGLLKGGTSGPAIVPGKPVGSLLLKALRNDEIAMPPKGKLPDDVIANFERWIRMGAPDPRDGQAAAAAAAPDLQAGRRFWAFQPLRRHDTPNVADASWPRGDIDRFILAALEARGLKPGRDADRTTLIRRVALDLIGLPPTPDEVAAFVNDPSPDAFARVVDRLLASPHFGERWGRHWLDVARYADSNGKDENLTFHEAFRYRDYVIDSFNRDKPFDQFVMEQVAGDLLPAADPGQRDEHLTGTGFLVVGPKVLADRDFLKRKMDVVDEQIDTVGKTFLGLTLGCARCHDHKFDPIPTTDYYGLAGIFASTRTLDGIKLGNAVVSGWMLRPLGAGGDAAWSVHKEHQKKRTAVADVLKKARAELKLQEEQAGQRATARHKGIVVDDEAAAKLVGQWKRSTYCRPYVGVGYLTDDRTGKGEKLVVFTPKLPRAGAYDVQVAYTAASNRSANTPVTIRNAEGTTTVLVNQTERPELEGLFRSVGTYRFEAGTGGSVTIGNEGTTGYVIVDAVRFVPVGAPAKGEESGTEITDAVRKQIIDLQAKINRLEGEEKTLKAAAPPMPALVMAVKDEDKPGNVRVNIRGNPHNQGAEVLRRGLVTVAALGPEPAIPANQSGRLELAHWLVEPANPLTARVLANRVWQHLLGEGLVRTVDNFGSQGERPTHPELLDELARRFIEEGWFVKRLIRTIVLSRVYQLGSDPQPAAAKVDPENWLLWRAHRRRVEAEVLRDAILAVSGDLDRTMGGPVVAGLGERAIDNESRGGVPTEANHRRSVYLPVIRNDLPQFFEVFDFADPDVATGRRDATMVPTQALFLMNSPFVMGQARQAARRLLALPADDAGRLAHLYQLALGRAPTEGETRLALRFLAGYRQALGQTPDPDVDAWAAVSQVMFGCTEFRFID